MSLPTSTEQAAKWLEEHGEARFILRRSSLRRVGAALVDFLRLLAAAVLAGGLPVEVVIRFYKTKRSVAQNRLAFKWYGERAKQLGTSRRWERAYCKLHHGTPILLAASDDFNDVFGRIIQGLPYLDQMRLIERLSVTRYFSAAQFTEYLNDIQRESAEQGLVLTQPAGMYETAMGLEVR